MDVTATTVQWLISGFLVTMAVVIPTTGFLLERFTPRSIYLVAVGSFVVGTLLCAVAVNFPALLIGRLVQASGTAIVLPRVRPTVMRLIPADKRGATMGTISTVIGVAPAIGPTVGGAVLAGLGWRWMFWLVLILAVAMLIFGVLRLHGPREAEHGPVDLLSAGRSAVGFAGMVGGVI